ncbi:MAG: L-lysine exporter family protein LysE/ArgO, partial [Granulosicoccus sp.]
MIYLTGLTLALGLIVAIGSQNAWVLSMSLRGQRPWPIALVCMSVDVVLMAIGVVA